MPDQPSEDAAPAVSPSDEIVKAYYSHVVDAAQVARGRAQVGFTIASAITVALGAGGLLSGIAERSTPVRGLAAVALACWFAAAFAFLYAASSPIRAPNTGEFEDADVADALLDNVAHERDCVQRRQVAAQWLVGAALVTTFATLCVVGLFRPRESGMRHAQVALRWPHDLPHTLPARCSGRTLLAGTVDPARLEEPVVELQDVPCADGLTLELPRRTIRAIALDGTR